MSLVYSLRRWSFALQPPRPRRSVRCHGKPSVNINALPRHEIQFWYPSRYLHAFVHSSAGSLAFASAYSLPPPLFSVQFVHRRRRLFIIYSSLFLSISSPVVITWFLHQCIPSLYIPHFRRPLSSYTLSLRKKGKSSLSSSPLHFLFLMFFLCFILSAFPSVLCRPNVRHVFGFVYLQFIRSRLWGPEGTYGYCLGKADFHFAWRSWILNCTTMRIETRIFEQDYFSVTYTGLFDMIVWVLTPCHTQYTWDRSICIFLFNGTTLQVFVTYLIGALYVLLLNKKYRVIRYDCQGFNTLSYTIHLR